MGIKERTMNHLNEIHALFGLLIATGKNKPKDNVPATIAKEIGYSKYTIADWLNGSKDKVPSPKAMKRIIEKKQNLLKELLKTLDK